MKSPALSVNEYIASLPEDRRGDIAALRDFVKIHMPIGYEEVMNWGMITYEIPLSKYPNTYNKQPLGYVSIASQKNYMALYLMCVYADSGLEKSFREAWAKTGKKLDMGKSCIRFKAIDDLALDVLAETISSVTPDHYIEIYEQVHGNN